ncbi:bifunctional glycosyltransferase/CDP-glycerol:glycerophosphate glycerophosphotransferase [Allosalinactinospora lopnorensis]|uniref:bifunctional glycosyltransferase/CDP-glycerol:glycerophosphate glycerophosphotransferase n=1 Tax=Allosalinactinospora lopnorensis TaxID=1352348 RepID=UPI000623E12B|nr:CDP-glycerol:glycerophosphate glycerophosphotransferase [Allosalinactinospora lopnorensis]
MPKLSVIVTFDVTEPHLQYCLDSLNRQSRVEGAEIVLAPVETRTAPVQPSSADPSAGVADDGDAADAADTGEAEASDEDQNADAADEEGSEAIDTARAEGMAVAREAVADSPPGLTLLGEPAATRAEARSRGVRASSGGYLMFLDGADALTGYALSYLAASINASGADVATGNVYRFNELGARQSGAHRKIFGAVRTGTDVHASTSLLGDRLYGNKVWRRSFWEALDDLGLADADTDLAVVRALFAARSIDVLPAPVLLLRDKESGADLSEIQTLTRRLSAVTALSGSLSGADRDLWDATALKSDLRSVLLRLDDASDVAWERFFDLANTYLDRIGRDVLDGISALHRLNYYLVRKRQGERLLETITFQKSVELKKAPVVRRGLHYYISYPFFEDESAGIPREVYRLGSELKVRQKTERVEWRDGKLLVRGRVGVQHLRARRRWQQHLVAFAVNTGTGRRIPVPVKVRRAAEYRLSDIPDAARHDYGGFEIALDPSRLRLSGQWQATEWKLELVVINRGLVRRRMVSNPVAGPPERPPYHRVSGEVWIRPSWDRGRELSIAVAPVRARVTGHRIDHADRPALEITGEFVAPPAAESHRLRLCRLPGTAELEYPLQVEGGSFTVRVPASELLANAVDEGRGQLSQEQWEATLRTPDGTSVPLVLPDEVDPAAHPAGDGHHEIAVQRTSTGHLRVRAGWAHPVVRGAHWSDRELVLAGHYAADSDVDLVFKARGREEEHTVSLVREGNVFRATFTPAGIPTLSGTLPLSSGTYQLWARVHLADGGSTDISAELDADFVRSLPLGMATSEREYAFADSGFDTPVLRVGSDLRPEERGSFAQQQLREAAHPAMRQESLREEILFDSYTGRQFSDSPHSIYAELRARGDWAEYPMSWLVKDGQVNLPPDLTPVRHNGREFYEALARSRYLVTNSRQPAWFTHRPDQTVVQTWHGSMLKRIGFDIENIRGKSRDYHEKLAWETRQWDYLVSPSPWATPILRRAFRFDGEILETGYPRNDIFFSPERDAIAARTRRRLGLPEGKKVILYAPTWRDDKYYTRGKHKLDLHLDLRRMYAKLGDDHVLLVRRHPRVVDSVPIVGTDFVYDVSLYPEIMELFLVTDILVTDYSSMMFDFANTGRPMLFFTYDIESYRDNLRGFYFDFEETAPGPLLLESDDVIGAITDIDGVAAAYRDKYRTFTDRFCPLDDGNAAARVVDRVFGRD